MKRIYKIGLIASFMLVILAANTFASPYEWFREVKNHKVVLSGTFQANNPGQDNKIYWYPSTSSNYYEYRALYLWVNSTWVRITEADHQGYINGDITDRTFDVPFTGLPPASYSARITINWAGCGGYTPNPDVDSCGDLYNFNLTLT